jgi:hypothetical protein
VKIQLRVGSAIAKNETASKSIKARLDGWIELATKKIPVK